MAKKTAVIDIGSNSCRMVIYEKTSRFSFRLLQEIKSRVRIGEGAYQNGGELQEFAMQRAFDALSDFVAIAHSYGVRKTLCVATSALRDAPNANTFINRVSRSLGLNIKVIDGQKEAYLGGVAAANLLAPESKAITIDIGGGSTEFALIENGSVTQTISIDIGTVRIKELYFDTHKIEEGLAAIDQAFTRLSRKASCVIAIGGTARAISKSIMKTTDYPLDKLHGFAYEVDAYNGFIQKLMTHSDKKLKKLKIKADRIDTIKPGAAIFLSALKSLGAKRVVTSGVGVREGLFLSDLLRRNNHRFPPNFNPSVKNMIVKYCDNKRYVEVTKLAMQLFQLLHERYRLTLQDKELLTIAAKLSRIGNYINIYRHNKLGEMLVLNELNYGFTHAQIASIAVLIRYSKNRFPPKDHHLAPLVPDYEKICILSFILSLALKLSSRSHFVLEDNILKIDCDYVVAGELENLQLPQGLQLKVTV